MNPTLTPTLPPAEPHPLDRLVDTKTAAAILALSPLTLIDWRCLGTTGPAFVKMGSAVRYRLSDLQAWTASCTKGA